MDLEKLKDKVEVNQEIRDILLDSLKKPSIDQIYQLIDLFCPLFEQKMQMIQSYYKILKQDAVKLQDKLQKICKEFEISDDARIITL